MCSYAKMFLCGNVSVQKCFCFESISVKKNCVKKGVCARSFCVSECLCKQQQEQEQHQGYFSSNSLAAWDHQTTAAGGTKSDFFGGNPETILGPFCG